MDDEALVHRARDGDLEAVGTLLGRHQRLAYTTALRFLSEPSEAEDMAQEAMIRAFTYLPELREGEAFAPWLRRIVVNLSLNVLRRRGRLRFESMDAGDDDAAPDVSSTRDVVDQHARAPEASAIRGDLLAEVGELLAQLPEEQRSALLLRDAYDYDVSEIAALQGCGLSAAKMRVSRARKALRQLLVEAGLQEESLGVARGGG